MAFCKCNRFLLTVEEQEKGWLCKLCRKELDKIKETKPRGKDDVTYSGDRGLEI